VYYEYLSLVYISTCMFERLRTRWKQYIYVFWGIWFFWLLVAFLTPYISLDLCTWCAYATDNEALLESIRWMEFLLKTLYLLMWPLIAVAWASLDNSLVYGEIFFLDTMLWKFWQIIRNFANFGIGLVFVWSILASFFYQNNEKFSLPNILKNTFIAGILVQMSRFIVAVLLDLSTVGIVGLGSLPMTILDTSEQNALQQVRYIKPHTLFNLDWTKQANADYTEHAIIYSCGDDSNGWINYYAPCWVKDNSFIKEGESADETESRKGYLQRVENVRTSSFSWSSAYDSLELEDDYCVWWPDLLSLYIIEDPGIMFGKPASPTNIKNMRYYADSVSEVTKSCNTMDKYITEAQWMTWPLFLLFAVIMDMWEIAITTTTTWATEAVFYFAVRAFIGIALMIPLAVMAVVLIIRSVILWLVIAFSPLLVLVFVYDYKSDGAQIWWGNLSSISDVLTLIFFPVFVVFAITLSVVFMTLISRIDFIKDTTSCEEDPMQLMWCEITNMESCKDTTSTNNSRTYDCFGVEFTLMQQSTNMWANVINTMSWLVKNFLWVALMWAIIFAALKMNKMTASIVSSVESLGKRLAMSTPIVPTSNGWMSLGGMQKAGQKIQNMPNLIAQNQYDSSPMKWWIDDFQQGMKWETKPVNDKLNEVSTRAWAADALKEGWVNQSNVMDYNAWLWNTLWHYANQPPGTYKTAEDALKSSEVIAALSNGGKEMSLEKFIEKWHTEDNGFKEYERHAALGHMATWTRELAESTWWYVSADKKADKHTFRFAGQNGETRVVTYNHDVATGNYTWVATNSFSAGDLSRESDITALWSIVSTHWWTIEKIEEILWTKEYTKDIREEMAKTANDGKAEFNVTSNKGLSNEITYTVTRGEKDNEIGWVTYVSGWKKDADTDGDGVNDDKDAFVNDANESVDTDGDQIGDNADTDDDNDGYSDALEEEHVTSPLDASSTPDGSVAKDETVKDIEPESPTPSPPPPTNN